MSTLYKIRNGFSFVLPDGSVKIGGETIELDDDIADQHAHKLEQVAEAPEQTGAKKDKPKKPAEPGTDPA